VRLQVVQELAISRVLARLVDEVSRDGIEDLHPMKGRNPREVVRDADGELDLVPGSTVASRRIRINTWFADRNDWFWRADPRAHVRPILAPPGTPCYHARPLFSLMQRGTAHVAARRSRPAPINWS
jgi:hypothetical protein